MLFAEKLRCCSVELSMRQSQIKVIPKSDKSIIETSVTLSEDFSLRIYELWNHQVYYKKDLMHQNLNYRAESKLGFNNFKGPFTERILQVFKSKLDLNNFRGPFTGNRIPR